MADEKSQIENKSNRMSKTEYYLAIALAVSKRSTCLKRRYGAVIVNNDEIISTGYNGNPRGEENCSEQNAMISARRKDMLGASIYLAGEMSVDGDWVEIEDAEPCPICFRMIKNSGIDKIVSKKGILKLRYPLQ